jgi:hypothetical protein
MGIEKFNFEGVGMVVERVIDGRRERSPVMAWYCNGMSEHWLRSQLERVPTLPRLPQPVPWHSGPAYLQKNETR